MQAITKTNVGRDLGLLLRHLLGSTNREFFAELQDAGISFSQLKCLGLLSNADAPLSLGALSEDLGLSLAAVSRAVDGLVQRGQVKRQEDPSDRRSKLVTVSARGRSTYERVVAVRAAGVKRFVEGLEPDQRDALGAALAPIVEELTR
ncbi:MAG TPA: MarR family transcriptional regulator [Thermoleophilaceae bacterium]|nr:MarR family transcriptional regulator [Thermoleophilaceae bacterium]